MCLEDVLKVVPNSEEVIVELYKKGMNEEMVYAYWLRPHEDRFAKIPKFELIKTVSSICATSGIIEIYVAD